MVSESKPTSWRTGSYCDSNACVEVGYADNEVHIRHTDEPHAPIVFTRSEWDAFVASVKAGEFD